MLVTFDTITNDLSYEYGTNTLAVLYPQTLFTLYDSSESKPTKYIYQCDNIFERRLSDK